MEHVSVSDVREAVSHLNAHRRDGCTGLESNHIINAGNHCIQQLGDMHQTVISHGALRDSFLNSTIIPIPKARNVSMCESANYRGIALSSVYLKIVDNIVLHTYSAHLSTSELQFGFKRKSSTNLCTFVLKVISIL